MIKIKPFLLGCLVTTALAGCTSQDYIDTTSANLELSQEMAQYTQREKADKVELIVMPPLKIEPIIENVEMPWLTEKRGIKVSDIALSSVVSKVMEGVSIPVWYGEGVDPNKRVSLNVNAPRGEVLNLLSREAGVGITPTENRLDITKFVTETFDIQMPAGDLTSQLGSQGTAAGEGENTRIEGQYLTVQLEKQNVLEELSASVKSILNEGDESFGSVSHSKAMTTLTVRTTPQRMESVRKVVNHYKRGLEKQVMLDIQVIEFRSNLGKEQGIDWNIVKQTSDGLIKFVLPGTDTVSNGAGYGLAFEGSGEWDGTSTFIKVLEKQGTVSTESPVIAPAVHNIPVKLSQRFKIPYLSDIASKTQEGGVVSTETKRDKEFEGIELMAIANIQRDDVWIRLTGKLSKVVDDSREKVAENNLRFLKTQESEINVTSKLKLGQTIMIASIKQTSQSAEQVTNFWSRIFGGEGVKNETVETLVLLTPRRS
ncbi:conserved exported hypothetical protein [Vibrio nigripulchritudo FTn2]|uniref:hypothetical protein n=1 Tax=Vibrio nigripulchritudo TaxID=28173 RepID=UPI0003B18F86|nr:hypothetical protein [Vibrio nigripulchritudo]BCL74184.1 hypothetical protein VNTUMSATTG_61210 [Vibrio nigripulchritudo]CCN39730.1 conserved exported hypothetical protein [Vibrio nigripulchritudo FTn2]